MPDLDHSVASLGHTVDAKLRDELHLLLRTLRDVGYVEGVLDLMMRLSLRFTSLIYSDVGRRPRNDNLFSRIEELTSLQILPDEISSYLQLIRILSNKPHHDAAKIRLQITDAENVLRAFLRVLIWYYCEWPAQPTPLTTIYAQQPLPTVTLRDEVQLLRSELAERAAGPVRSSQFVVGLRPAEVAISFKDRYEQLAELTDLLGQQHIKLVCIVGRGGMGKTALLAKVCEDIEKRIISLSDPLTPRALGGIVYWRFRNADLPGLSRLFSDFAQVLGSPDREDLMECWRDRMRSQGDKIEFLLGKLRSAHYLLVLDNLEAALGPDHRLKDATLEAFVEQVLTTSATVRLLATSREPMCISSSGLRNTRIVRLESGLPEEEGMSLLRDLDFSAELGLRDASEPLLKQIVARCCGIPRALEAVAGMLVNDPTLAPDSLVLDNKLFHKQIVETLVAENYYRTSDDNKRVLEALAIFNSSVPMAAVDCVVHAFFPEIRVEECLHSLVRSFMVRYDRRQQMFSLHPIDQQQAYSKIPQEGASFNKAACHEQAAHFFLRQNSTMHEVRALSDVDPILSAVSHFRLADKPDEACRALDHIDPTPLSTWGHYELIVGMRSAIVAAQADDRLKCASLGKLGSAFANMGRNEEAIASYLQSLELARSIGDELAAATRLGNLGEAYFANGDMLKAREHFVIAQASDEGIGERGEAGFWLGHVGLVCMQTGDLSGAADCFTAAAKIAKEIGDQRRYASWISNLGSLRLAEGRTEIALQHYREAAAIAEAMNDRRGMVARLRGIGQCLAVLRQTEEAFALFRRALGIAQSIHSSFSQAGCFCSIGRLERDLGHFCEARANFLEALAMNCPSCNYICVLQLGIISLLQEQPSREYFRQTIALSSSLLELSPNRYEVLFTRALAWIACGKLDVAIKDLRQALSISSAHGTLAEVRKDISVMERVLGAQPEIEALLMGNGGC
jgi:tetratricopeptide (TPR) repeat protein